GNMLEQKYIDQAQYDEALADPVYDRILQTAAITEDTTPYSYFTDALIEDVIQDLMDEKGYSETQAYNLIYSEGLTIKSTQDLAIQQICDEEASNDAYYP
ncbi:glycosyl transferase, partial [[Ruminococcus] torques]|nr:glycosyl transferase [[Ruminococcus] torques]